MRKVPKLRFKEFSDEWKEKKLGEFGKISMCKRIMKDQTTLTGDIPFYKIGTFGKKADAYIDKKLFEEYKEKYSFPKKGDILLSASGTIGRTVIYDGKPAYFQDSNIVWIATNEKIILNSFLNYLYSNIKWTIENTTIARLYNDNLANMKVNIPFLQEQEKIANFLSSVDKKISLTEEKLELFREYKKGVMQKIFSQELRFKDNNGNDYPEWEEKKLVEISELTSSKRIFLNEYVDKGIPFYRGKEITELKKGKKVTDILYISNKKYNEILEKYDVPKQNEILITAVGTLGNVYLISNNEKFYFKDGNLIWLKNIKSLPKFLTYSLENNYKKILDTAIGSTQKALTIVNLQKLQLIIPVSLEEQQKISDFLSSIDSKIESIEKELDRLKEFKRGLLQQMFV